MSAVIEDLSSSLATMPWRPRSLDARRPPWLRARWRVLILLGIVALHVLGSRSLLRLLAERDHSAGHESVLLVDFIQVPPPPERPPVAAPLPVTAAGNKPGRARARSRPALLPRRRDDAAMQAEIASAPASPAPSATGLALYDQDGRLRVPADMLAQIDKQVGGQRVFSYQVPHLDDAKKYFYRNKVLDYEPTHFDQYWKPDQDLLTDLLTKLAEKTTKQIRIPIPGHPGSTMVCSITLIALSGGCGVLTNGSDYVGPVDDPDTLSPQEDRQCRAWWDQIIGARTQDLWRKTRSLYESQCRKPLLREK